MGLCQFSFLPFPFVSTLLHLSSFPIQLAPSFPIQHSRNIQKGKARNQRERERERDAQPEIGAHPRRLADDTTAATDAAQVILT